MGLKLFITFVISIIESTLLRIRNLKTFLNSTFLSTHQLEFIHGFDKFSYGMVTTLSRFSDAINDRALKINVKVVSEPPESLASKALDNGSMNVFSLLILSSLLAVWRRPR